MATLVLMVGAPGSGKSTWLKKYMSEDDICVSRDEIRFHLVKPEEDYFSKETEVFNIFIYEIDKALSCNKFKKVYVDATHLNKRSRLKVLSKVHSLYDGIEIIYLKKSLDTCLAQNEERKGTRSYVPRGVIRRMYESIKEPCFREDEFYYDTITIISEGTHNETIVTKITRGNE